MFVKNGMEQYDLRATDFSLSSTARGQIILPYKAQPWADLLLEIEREICERTPDGVPQVLSADQSIDECDVSVVFNIQQHRVGLLALAKVKSPVAGNFLRLYHLRAENSEVKDILDQFFACGAEGLSDEHRTYYKTIYGLWRKTH